MAVDFEQARNRLFDSVTCGSSLLVLYEQRLLRIQQLQLLDGLIPIVNGAIEVSVMRELEKVRRAHQSAA